MRSVIQHTRTPPGAPTQTGHVCLRPGLIEEHQPLHLKAVLSSAPRLTTLANVQALLFAGPQRFFYTDTPAA